MRSSRRSLLSPALLAVRNGWGLCSKGGDARQYRVAGILKEKQYERSPN
ncbi:hypothetical protein EI42_04030 [Thermosporothrix hazakensis]|jgi:hypothetical protein|uniref:Uncharacterized protein n=1 Tax=Thermosporothrix hazakensis TaxID=644383 RepID=A0A326U4C6_THEHA|nr:hypothetical protein EI42_04030 [Thermosporothrix hazakensis]